MQRRGLQEAGRAGERFTGGQGTQRREVQEGGGEEERHREGRGGLAGEPLTADP